MKETDPYTMKRLGNQHKSDTKWAGKQVEIMQNILVEKFQQNAELKDYLVNTGSATYRSDS